MQNKEIIFHIPGAFTFYNGVKALGMLQKEYSFYFKDNVKIGSAYGSPLCIWNGGRFASAFYTQDELRHMSLELEELNIPVRFTFTNCLLEEKHTYDTWGNVILDIFNNGHNEVICNSTVLENYIRNTYGHKYKYISSTTKRLNNVEQQNNELNKNYYLVVLDYDFNKDFDYLMTIENKEKCELLCNPVCHPNCINRSEHYEDISFSQLNNSISNFKCEDMYKSFWEVQKNPNFISNEEIKHIYSPLGFSNFKIEGRTTHALDWIEIILYYLIKEEYHLEVRDFLQQSLLSPEE